MLEKPPIPDALIIDCLEREYGLRIAELEFLPLGADANTVVYRALADNDLIYFAKLRSGAFDENSVLVPKFLHTRGIRPIIAPVAAKSGHMWIEMDGYWLILYPFVHGRDGYDVALSKRQWQAYGAALRQIHATTLPNDLAARVRREDFSPRWRDATRQFLEQARRERFTDPAAIELAIFLRDKEAAIVDLIERAGRYAALLKARPPEFVLCHADLHPGNVLIDDENFYLVDWDDPIFAPRERDLMYFGSGLTYAGRMPDEEEALIRRGYGPYDVDPVALAYYRFERIVQDIAAYCEELLLTDEGGADREQSLRYVKYNFLPDKTIARAYAAATAIGTRGANNEAD